MGNEPSRHHSSTTTDITPFKGPLPIHDVPPPPAGAFFIRSRMGNIVLDLPEGSKESINIIAYHQKSRDEVMTLPERNRTNQVWELVPLGRSIYDSSIATYIIRNRSSGTVLAGRTASEPGHEVYATWREAESTAAWKLIPLDLERNAYGESGKYWWAIRNQATGRYLDIEGSKTSDGTPIITWDWQGSRNQQWELVDITEGSAIRSRPGRVTLRQVTKGRVGDKATLAQYASQVVALVRAGRDNAEALVPGYLDKDNNAQATYGNAVYHSDTYIVLDDPGKELEWVKGGVGEDRFFAVGHNANGVAHSVITVNRGSAWLLGKKRGCLPDNCGNIIENGAEVAVDLRHHDYLELAWKNPNGRVADPKVVKSLREAKQWTDKHTKVIIESNQDLDWPEERDDGAYSYDNGNDDEMWPTWLFASAGKKRGRPNNCNPHIHEPTLFEMLSQLETELGRFVHGTSYVRRILPHGWDITQLGITNSRITQPLNLVNDPAVQTALNSQPNNPGVASFAAYRAAYSSSASIILDLLRQTLNLGGAMWLSHSPAFSYILNAIAQAAYSILNARIADQQQHTQHQAISLYQPAGGFPMPTGVGLQGQKGRQPSMGDISHREAAVVAYNVYMVFAWFVIPMVHEAGRVEVDNPFERVAADARRPLIGAGPTGTVGLGNGMATTTTTMTTTLGIATPVPSPRVGSEHDEL